MVLDELPGATTVVTPGIRRNKYQPNQEVAARTLRIAGTATPVRGRWGDYNPDDVRQFRRDFREWMADAQGLRRDLQNAGVDPRELDQVLRDLRQFENDQAYVDPMSLDALQAAALEKLKTMEFGLKKKADGKDLPITLSGSEEVPVGFRDAIQEGLPLPRAQEVVVLKPSGSP